MLAEVDQSSGRIVSQVAEIRGDVYRGGNLECAAEPFDNRDVHYGPVKISTDPYSDMLRRTRNYNAFGDL